MNSKLFGLALLLLTYPFTAIQAADQAQSVTVSENLQIPGANLKPGTYNFSLEDQLSDRAIIRISNAQDANEHYLILAVPNPKLGASASNHLAYFKQGNDGRQSLKAWQCASCSAPLEVVYPKLEAVKLTDESTEPVLAVDPSSDKLPSNLSADDMKVVTLWLLSPERISADNVGQGVKAVKYTPEAAAVQAAQNSGNTTAAPSSTPAPATASQPSTPAQSTVAQTSTSPQTTADRPVQMASVAASPHASDLAPRRRRLPKTASNTFSFGVYGLICLAGALLIRVKRQTKACASR